MTAERLYELLTFLVETDTRLAMQKTLDALADAFDNLVTAPSTVANQTALSTNMQNLERAFQLFQTEATPGQWEALSEIGGAKYFDVSLPQQIRQETANNPLSPSVVQDSVRKLSTARKSFMDNLRATRKGLELLGVESAPLKPDTQT